MSHLRGQTGSVPETQPAECQCSALAFARYAHTAAAAARAAGAGEFWFRSPPRLAGVDRSLARRADGSVVVAVRRRGRPLRDVAGDMVEGVVVASGRRGEAAAELRRWLAGAVGLEVPAPDPAGLGDRSAA